jgi:hypothetical protein
MGTPKKAGGSGTWQAMEKGGTEPPIFKPVAILACAGALNPGFLKVNPAVIDRLCR